MSKFYLSRLSITGLIDVNTPKCVIIDIADSHHLEYGDNDFIKGNQLARFINKINTSEIGVVEEPFTLKEYKYIAHFLNKNIKWPKSKALHAFKFLNSFTKYQNLRNIPENFNFGLQTPDEIYNLNASVLYAFCRSHQIHVSFGTTLTQMANYLKMYSMINSKSNESSSIKRNIKINIFNVLKYNDISSSNLINIFTYLNNNLPSGILNSNRFDKHDSSDLLIARKKYSPSSINYDDLECTYISIHSNIDDITPVSHLEAIVVSAIKYKFDILNTQNPLEEYKALKQIPYFPNDRDLIYHLKKSNINDDWVFNPHLDRNFNPKYPKCFYSSEILVQLCKFDGIPNSDILNDDPYTLLQYSYLTSTFVHGRQQNIINKRNTLYEDISDLEDFQILCYGVRKSEMYAFTYQELSKSFEINRNFCNPASKDNILFTPSSISRLKILLKHPRYPNETLEHFQIRSDLKEIISSVQLFLDSGNSKTSDFAHYYDILMPHQQKDIQHIFHLLLNLSMYMRGWSGKGPFPLESIDTNKTDPITVNMNVSHFLDKFIRTCESSDIGNKILSLPLIFYSNNFHLSSNPEEGLTIGDRINIVRSGENTHNMYSCVRMTSNRFASTAYYYMQLIKMKRPFDIQKLSSIS